MPRRPSIKPPSSMTVTQGVDAQGRRVSHVSTVEAQVQPNHRRPPGPIGNTTGMIVPDTAPNPSFNTAPPIQPTKKEEGWWKSWGSAVTHGVLDVVGLIPVVGEIADGANALIYVAEGDYVNAAISAAAMVPGAGMAATGAKYGKKAVDAVQAGKVVKEAAEAAAEKAAKEAAEKAAKEAAEAAAKTTARKAANKGQKGGKNKSKKKKLKCGEGGTYGDLKKKTGDGKFDRDHIPSKAALKEKALEQNLGVELTPAQKRAIDAAGEAIAIPRQAHIDVSPTHGTKNIELSKKDAMDLADAAKRDVDEMLKKIDEYDEDGGCKKAYKKAAKKVLSMTNEDYSKMLQKILDTVK